MSEELQEESVMMYAPEGATEVSFHGQRYEVIDGVVEVPHVAVSDLISHGFALEPVVSAEEEQAAINKAVQDVKEQKRRSSSAKTKSEPDREPGQTPGQEQQS